MPFSIEKQIELERLHLKYMRKQFKKESDQIWEKSINYAYEELYREAYHMYDAFIDQYYEYKTKSYIRHGESRPGTQRGINLYRGQQIEYKPGLVPSLTIDFSGKDMERYRNNSTDEVLEMVMNGIRGVPGKGWWETWTGSYFGKHFSIQGSTISKAFEIFNDNFDFMANKLFQESYNKEINSGKYEFHRPLKKRKSRKGGKR